MVGYSSKFNTSDSLNGRKLRPLIPRPSTITTTHMHNNSTHPAILTNHSCYTCIQSAHPFGLHQQKGSTSGNRSIGGFVSSSRWAPTPEQLQALEEMFRCGIRTPTAEQIQQIAANLGRFGRIEGKNVFYWFQNHKARQRQKRRLVLESESKEQLHPPESIETKHQSEVSRTVFGVRERKNWATNSDDCSAHSEEHASLHRGAEAESRTSRWSAFEERELEPGKSSGVPKHATCHCHMMELSCTRHLSNPITMPTTAALPQPSLASTINPNLISNNAQQLGLLFADPTHMMISGLDDQSRESQALELFPLQSDSQINGTGVSEEDTATVNINIGTTPNQYFEFLPLKN